MPATFLFFGNKMLLCPYDNDMWVRYETTYLKSGRTSYDISAIFDPDSLNGLVIGSIDNNIWKMALNVVNMMPDV